ncbi:MAG: flagellar assembly protein T N-terminal domain-containing protein [Spirochaetia bacterium]|nr:flagellar assembly protein T N-terminal domain-containing protein [Spirochaetia bacterium]
MRKVKINTSALILVISLGCSSGQKTSDISGVDSNWVIGEGMAQVYQDDVALAKDRALRAAKKDAIQRKLGQLIQSKSITESGVWVKGEVTAKSKGLVKDYIIKSENKMGDLYKMTIKAEIEPSDLKSAIDDLLSDWEQPVIFGIVHEKFDNKLMDPYDSYSLQSISEFFLEKNFAIHKTSSWQGKIKHPLSIEKIASYAEDNDADFDILIFGSTECTNAGNVMNSKLQSAQVNIEISMFDISTRRLMAAASKHSASAHIDFQSGCRAAIEKAGKTMQNDLFKQMLRKWDKEYGSGKTVILEINGNLSYKKLYDLENDFRDQIRGVVDVIERTVNPGKAMLDLIYSGQVKDLAQELVQKKLSVPLTVTSKSGRKIVLSVK